MKEVGTYDSHYIDGMMNYFAVVTAIKEMNIILHDEIVAIDEFIEDHPEFYKRC